MGRPKIVCSNIEASYLSGFLASWFLGILAVWLTQHIPGFLASWILGSDKKSAFSMAVIVYIQKCCFQNPKHFL